MVFLAVLSTFASHDIAVLNIRSSRIRLALKKRLLIAADIAAREPNLARYLSEDRFSVGMFSLCSGVSL